MKRKTFADKLAAGTAEASAVGAWWPQHSCEVSAYLKAGAEPSDRKRHSDQLITLAREWDDRLRDPQELMMQHAGLEIALVNAAVISDREAIDKLQQALRVNALDQMQMLCKIHRSFPAQTFASLMKEHALQLVEAVGYWMDRHPRKLSACEGKRRQNAVSLGMLLTEWI